MFAVEAQNQTQLLHESEHGVSILEAADTVFTMGSHPFGVQLAGQGSRLLQ